MNANFFVFFRTSVLIFSFVFSVSSNSFGFNFTSEDAKPEKLTRPRVYKETKNDAQPTEPTAAKAIVSFTVERQVFDLINQQRAAIGLAALVWSDDLAKIARAHSENMANFKFFSHAGVDGSLINDRADSFGISNWRAIGENIAFNQGYDNPGAFAVERWMLSPGHRENILNNRWTESAIGVAFTADKKYYLTEVFLLKY